MRTAQITIGTKQYWMCNSLGAQIAIDELPKMESMVKKALYILKILMDAGYTWARKQGQVANEPPEISVLEEDFSDEDLEEWLPVIQKVRFGERNVEAKPSKKAEAEASAG